MARKPNGYWQRAKQKPVPRIINYLFQLETDKQTYTVEPHQLPILIENLPQTEQILDCKSFKII